MDKATTRKAARVRAAVKALGARGPGRRYPEAVKREALTYLAALREEGRGIATASKELGIPERSLKLWAGAPRPGTATFVPMAVATVTEEAAAPRLAVYGPAGLRVEGLDLGALVDLLRRLA